MKANGDLGVPETKVLAVLVRNDWRFVKWQEIAGETGMTYFSITTTISRIREMYGREAIEGKYGNGYRINRLVVEAMRS